MNLAIRNVKKSFNETVLFSDLNLDLQEGKIIAFFGPNGCGKSTFLNMLVRITSPDAGTIPQFEKVSYMFQNYLGSLLPWRTNFDNIGLPLELQGVSKRRIAARVRQLYNKYGIHIDLNAYPYELSGGQKQFVAFLRSIITEPHVIMLDEPFSALDYENSLLLSNKLQEYHTAHKPTILVITHDIEEAVYLADEIIVFSRKPTTVVGRIKKTLPRPRKIEMLQKKEFHSIKKKVLQLFQTR